MVSCADSVSIEWREPDISLTKTISSIDVISPPDTVPSIVSDGEPLTNTSGAAQPRLADDQAGSVGRFASSLFDDVVNDVSTILYWPERL